MNKVIKILIFSIAVSLVLLGFYGFNRGANMQANVSNNENREFPLSDCREIVVDDEGNIYVGVQFYSRVQVYDNNGVFKLGFDIKSLKGAFRLNIDNSNNILVATTRNKMLFVYNKNGEILNKYSDNESFDKFGLKNEYQYVDKRGITYKISNPLLMYPQIIKIMPDGTKIIVKNTSFKEWVVMGPLPAWIFMALGLGIIMVLLNKSKLMAVLSKIKE